MALGPVIDSNTTRPLAVPAWDGSVLVIARTKSPVLACCQFTRSMEFAVIVKGLPVSGALPEKLATSLAAGVTGVRFIGGRVAVGGRIVSVAAGAVGVAAGAVGLEQAASSSTMMIIANRIFIVFFCYLSSVQK